MEHAKIDTPDLDRASTSARRAGPLRGRLIFLGTFLVAWFALDQIVTSPPTAASGLAALLAAGGVLVASESLLSDRRLTVIARRIGIASPNRRSLVAATSVGAAVVASYVAGAALLGIDLTLRANWPTVLVGVLLFHGLAEELVWRGYAFGYFRRRHRFWPAIAWSVPLIALTHVPMLAGDGVAIGTLAVLTAAVTCLPFAYLWEQSGRTVWAPAILHGCIGTWQLFERDYGTEFSLVVLGTSIFVPLATFLFRARFFTPRA